MLECCICMEYINNGGHTTTCNHTFHRNCLTNWYNLGCVNCPLCRCSQNIDNYESTNYDEYINLRRDNSRYNLYDNLRNIIDNNNNYDDDIINYIYQEINDIFDNPNNENIDNNMNDNERNNIVLNNLRNNNNLRYNIAN